MLKRVLLPLTVGLAVFATPSPSARQDETDNWKTALGWNGTYTPPEKVGDNMTDGLNLAQPFGGVYFCQDIEWQGNCGYSVLQCYNCIELRREWSEMISSMSPDPGTDVVIYEGPNCQNIGGAASEAARLSYPGVSDFRTIPPGTWNDNTRSFMVRPAGH
ncbi:hypothetical protein BT96DRAFT_493127 [Gymnopus androsaceus JB14]|uniref:Uncharacterized protein n=1 Tax=Gymnopus androsaceus JB14 TaxID=1447944 RepID=A0A6A4GPH2_9AGAR|nr:hypothetical protein BT96DRAFT_493127 [Gymnopus androsaceus JB14]